MCAHQHDRCSTVAAFAALMLAAILPASAIADSHPQEVLDLVAAYDALAMKVRPLQDRVSAAASPGAGETGFRPDGVPLRAQVGADAGTSDPAAEQRVSERLRHKNRAAPTADDYGRIKARLSALEEKARAERARISSPGFGMTSVRTGDDAGSVRFGDARRGTRPPSQSAPAAPDTGAIADARKTLAAMQRELDGLEREVRALERR